MSDEVKDIDRLPVARCSFCGHPPAEGEILVQGPTLDLLCTACAKLVAKTYGSQTDIQDFEKKQSEQNEYAQKRAAPKVIKQYLDEYIIEQDPAKQILSTAIYNHMMRVKMKHDNVPGAADIEKANIIMVGPSGVGKTAIIRRLANAMGVPFVIEDITSFSSTGFVGRDVEGMLRDLLDAANGDIETAERGIIYIDEIDKCSRKGDSPSISSDPSHEALQQALLKLIEGSVVEVSAKKGERHHPNAPTFKFNTENVLFIVGGAFEGIDKIIAKRQKKYTSSIGIGSKLTLDEDKAFNERISDLEIEDLKKYGMLPELLGRLPVLCTLQALSKESLVRILTEPKNSLLKQYQTLFRGNDIDLDFSKDALNRIAEKAIERGTGARSLRGIVESVLGDVMYEAPSDTELTHIIIDVEDDEFITKKDYEDMKKEEVL